MIQFVLPLVAAMLTVHASMTMAIIPVVAILDMQEMEQFVKVNK